MYCALWRYVLPLSVDLFGSIVLYFEFPFFLHVFKWSAYSREIKQSYLLPAAGIISTLQPKDLACSRKSVNFSNAWTGLTGCWPSVLPVRSPGWASRSSITPIGWLSLCSPSCSSSWPRIAATVCAIMILISLNLKNHKPLKTRNLRKGRS